MTKKKKAKQSTEIKPRAEHRRAPRGEASAAPSSGPPSASSDLDDCQERGEGLVELVPAKGKRADKTEIGWTHMKGYVGRTWNPVTGCHKVSPGCKNCYAETIAERFRGVIQPNGKPNAFHNGFDPTLRPERIDEPRSWRSPQAVFVNSMSDLFGEFVPDDYLDRVFATMRDTPRHIYQILTKRADRLREYSRRNPWLADAKHIWLGVSVEDRKYGLPRVELLRQSNAAVKFLSIEPLLESLGTIDLAGIQWVIVGGESGPKARPMHPDWARGMRDQSITAGIPFFFKQWGEFDEHGARRHKKHSGRSLDGRTWDEFPCGEVANGAPANARDAASARSAPRNAADEEAPNVDVAASSNARMSPRTSSPNAASFGSTSPLSEPHIAVRRVVEIADLDRSIHARASLSAETVARYAADMRAGDVFPPGDAFEAPTTRQVVLATAYHRVAAKEANGETHVEVLVHVGDRRAALLWGLAQDRNLKRSNADKRHAVRLMLSDSEWVSWSDQVISRQCGVDAKTVADERQKLGLLEQGPRRGGDGRTRDTTNIGKGPRKHDKPTGVTEVAATTTMEVPESQRSSNSPPDPVEEHGSRASSAVTEAASITVAIDPPPQEQDRDEVADDEGEGEGADGPDSSGGDEPGGNAGTYAKTDVTPQTDANGVDDEPQGRQEVGEGVEHAERDDNYQVCPPWPHVRNGNALWHPWTGELPLRPLLNPDDSEVDYLVKVFTKYGPPGVDVPALTAGQDWSAELIYGPWNLGQVEGKTIEPAHESLTRWGFTDRTMDELPDAGFVVVAYGGEKRRRNTVHSISVGWLENGRLPKWLFCMIDDFVFAHHARDASGNTGRVLRIWVRRMSSGGRP